MRPHGADIYDAAGKPRRILDFSNTVAEAGRAPQWRGMARRLLGRLEGYPQPKAKSLALGIADRLGTAPGTVLVANGSSEAMDWAARAWPNALIELPHFGEYPHFFARQKAHFKLWMGTPPARAPWTKPRRGQTVWLADPANPSGLRLGLAELRRRAKACRRVGARLLLDQALDAQVLGKLDRGLEKLAASAPGFVILRSLSKGLGLPGLRLGYALGHPSEIAALARFQDPWSVNSLAQAMGLWAFERELSDGPRRRAQLILWKRDLLKRLAPLKLWICPLRSDTGYFLAKLSPQAPSASLLAQTLDDAGLLVRDCSNYGAWGQSYLRLNPRAPKENARFVKALRVALKVLA